MKTISKQKIIAKKDPSGLGWLNYFNEIPVYYRQSFPEALYPVFSDSTVLYTHFNSSGLYEFKSIGSHAVGLTFDARAEFFGEFIYEYVPYYIDSVSIVAKYNKITELSGFIKS